MGDAHSRLIGGVRYEDASTYAEKRTLLRSEAGSEFPMRSRALPLALVLSGVLHAGVIAVSHNAAPTLTPDP